MWGYVVDGQLDGALLRRRQPGAGRRPTPRRSRAFADRARRQGRRCSSIVGPARRGRAAVARCSSRPGGRPARSAPRQPLMAIARPPPVAGRPAGPAGAAGRARRPAAGLRRDVHRGGRRLAASPPTAARSTAAGSPSWSRPGRAFARIEDGRVVFKAEIGAVTPAACQVQGVWVAPELRGQGLVRAGHGGGRRAGLREHRAGRQPLRQRLQRRRPARPTARVGFDRRRRLHVRPRSRAAGCGSADVTGNGCWRDVLERLRARPEWKFFRVLFRASPRLADGLVGACWSCAARCRRCWRWRPACSSPRSQRRVVADRAADLRRHRLRGAAGAHAGAAGRQREPRRRRRATG